MKKRILLVSALLATTVLVPGSLFAQVNSQSTRSATPDFATHENDEIVQRSNVRIIEISPVSPDAETVFRVVDSPNARCQNSSTDTGNQNICPPVPSVIYSIRVTSDTRLLLNSRRKAALTDFEVGDRINVYGFFDQGTNAIDALIVRDLSKPSLVKPIVLSGVEVIGVPAPPDQPIVYVDVIQNLGGCKPPAMCPQAFVKYTIKVNVQKTYIRDSRGSLIKPGELALGDKLNISGLLQKNNMVEARSIMDLSKPIGIRKPHYEVSPQDGLILGQRYTFVGKIGGALPNTQVYFYLQRPDGSYVYNGSPEDYTTDASGNVNFRDITATISPGAQIGTYVSWVSVGGVESNKAYHAVRSPVSLEPSISIASTPQADNGQVVINVGDKIVITGTPSNLTGEISKDYGRAFFFDPIFNSACSNDTDWEMVCIAKQPGVSRFYIEIYKGDRIYRSNVIEVTVRGSRFGALQVISPNGGETWTKGTTQTIQWQDNSPVPLRPCPVNSDCNPPPKYYDIKLAPYYPPCSSNICPAYLYHASYKIAGNTSYTYFPWSVGTVVSDDSDAKSTVPDGSYTIQVCQTGTDVCDSSDSYFKIVNGTVSSSVAVLSPNGGESIDLSRPLTVVFKPLPGVRHNINLWTPNWAWDLSGLTGSSVIGQSVDRQSITVTLPASYNVKPGQYKIEICTGVPGGSGSPCVYSGDYFTISSFASITVLSPNGGEVLTENSKVVDSLSSVDSSRNIFEIKWSGASDSFVDVYGNGRDPARIAAYLEQNNGGQFTTVGRIIPEAYGSIMWIVGQVSDTNCLMNNYDATMYPNHCSHSRRLVSPGQYYVRIVDTQTGAMDRSNAPFTIISSPTIPPSITVLSPNGGENWIKGTSHTISWNYANVSNVYIKLRKGSDTYYGSEGSVSGIISNTGSYKWTIPTTLPDGNDYRIRVIDSNSMVLDDSDAPFTISSGVSWNHAPAIDSLLPVIPNIQPGQAFAFYWHATDADNDNLSWSGNWGDNQVFVGPCGVPNPQNKGGWDFTIAHTWTNPGIYPVSITANDCNGGSDQRSFNVIVGNATSSIKVISPNGGEVYKPGDMLTIRWTPGSPGISQVYFVSATQNNNTVGVMATAPNTSGSFSFRIPDNFPLDKYWVDIYLSNGGQGFIDRSDASFTITNPSSNTPALISITPASGPIGTQITLRGSGFRSTGNVLNFGGIGTINNLASSDGVTLTFQVPSEFRVTGTDTQGIFPVEPGTYPLTVQNSNGTSNNLSFTVTVPLPACTPGKLSDCNPQVSQNLVPQNSQQLANILDLMQSTLRALQALIR